MMVIIMLFESPSPHHIPAIFDDFGYGDDYISIKYRTALLNIAKCRKLYALIYYPPFYYTSVL